MRNFFIGIAHGLLFLIFIGTGIVTMSFTTRAQENKVKEPEIIGVIYWLDAANNSLVQLDRQTYQPKRRARSR